MLMLSVIYIYISNALSPVKYVTGSEGVHWVNMKRRLTYIGVKVLVPALRNG